MAGNVNPNTGKRPSATGPSAVYYAYQQAQSSEKIKQQRNSDALASANKTIQDKNIEETQLQKQLKYIDEQIKYWTDIRQNSTSSTAIQNAITQIAKYNADRSTTTTKLKTVSADLNNAKTQRNILLYGIKPLGNYQMSSGYVLNKKTDKKDSSNTDLEGGTDNTTPGPILSWKYNPPMVKAAYLSSTGLQQQDGFMPVGNAGTWDDAKDAWKISQGSKGVIQMSRSYPYYFSKVVDGKATLITDDTTIYGFRFLYNPTTVSMSWGVDTSVDIAKFQSGQFQASPITDAAMNSTVTFSIILNRMLDMNHLTEGGSVIGNPYFYDISLTDAQGIYKRGTMWDLEYLFKAVNGKNVEYNSNLNESTADVGWLNSFPVELHLGSGLRYLVRVTQVNVDHKIFNERMVPIFSTVDFICKRLPDFAATDDSRNTGSGGRPNQLL